MPHIDTAIVVAKTLTLVFGGLVTYLSFKAYRRTGSDPLRSLAIGFGVITAGAILGGAVDVFSSLGVLYGVLVQSVLTTVGFAIITYSLYAD